MMVTGAVQQVASGGAASEQTTAVGPALPSEREKSLLAGDHWEHWEAARLEEYPTHQERASMKDNIDHKGSLMTMHGPALTSLLPLERPRRFKLITYSRCNCGMAENVSGAIFSSSL